MRRHSARVAAFVAAVVLFLPELAHAQLAAEAEIVQHWTGWFGLALFGFAYAFVILEERTHLRKSIPMIIAAGVLWTLVALSPAAAVGSEILHANVLEFAELFLFILAAVTFVNTM